MMQERSRVSLRSAVFVLCLLLHLLGTSDVAVRGAAAADRPNIVFIFSDDHATHAIGAYGGWLKDVAPTPHIDQLAREGALFRNSFCTNSICGPSRAVILTGKHSHLNGFRRNGDEFDGSQQTFPKLLRKAGYQTAMIGKWHLKSNPTGFDYWEILPGQGNYYNPDLISAQGRKRYTGHCTDVVTERAIEWLKNDRDPDQPFMLMCQHKAPHRRWMPALRHLKLFDDRQMPEPPTLFDDHADNASPARHQEMEISWHMSLDYDLKVEGAETKTKEGGINKLSGAATLVRMTPKQRQAWDAAYDPKNKAMLAAKLTGKDLIRWKNQRYLKDYLRCIKGVDESVGHVREILRELALAENTIVIYSSDQGFYLGDHGWYDKRWMYEESLKMPLVVYWPGVTRPSSQIEHLVQNLDYAETFLEIAGAEIPEDMQGRSLVGLLKGKNPSNWRNAVYYHYFEYPGVHQVARHFGIRTSRYKLIRFYQFDEWEFYDLKNDPDEVTNQYNNSEYSETISNLKDQLEQLRKQYCDNTDVRVMPEAWQRKQQGG